VNDGPPRGAVKRGSQFPAAFLWGAATSSYQIEGAVNEDGRGPSVWDTFSHTPGKVQDGDTGDVACDFYHRYPQDIELLANLGLNAFRFSIAWSRVQPDGRGPVNQPGLDFYKSLVATLRDHGIRPAITLHHWDLPQALEDAGGWPRRDTAERFAEFAQIIAAALGDTDALWMTLNEPQQVVHQGYRVGTHAPGHTDEALAAAATHHLLLAHGLALRALRATLPGGGTVGIAIDMHTVRAVGDDARELAATIDAEKNRIFFDPIVHGRYPQHAREQMLPPAALIEAGDMELIRAPIDFLGLNYYSPVYVKPLDADATGVVDPVGVAAGYKPPHLELSSMGWLIEPDGLLELLVTVNKETPDGLPLYVTENGCGGPDFIDPQGKVDDFDRVRYLDAHLRAAQRAIAQGVPLAGYFVWSLLDNFEWAHGYEARFGIVYVDYETQRRVAKRSASFYGETALANALPLEPPAKTLG
jgi:beta-glucosidase